MGKTWKMRGSWASGVAVMAMLGLGVGAAQLPSAFAATCSNVGLRVGPSAHLPDCRAYELVTPSNSNGRQFRDVQFSKDYDMFPTEMATIDGESLVFGTFGSSLLEPPGGGGRVEYDVYKAERSVSGWQTVRHVTPLPNEAMTPLPGGISADHAYIFTHVGPIEKIAGEFGSLYKGADADYLGSPTGAFELSGVGSLKSEPRVEGRYITSGGTHVIFTTGLASNGSQWCAIANSNFGAGSCQAIKLEPAAAPTGTGTIYDRAVDGPTHVVSLLPGNVSAAAGQDAVYRGTSKDAAAIAFDIEGVLYARVDNGSPTAATVKITEEDYDFAGFSDDDQYLFYINSGDVHRFNLETKVDSGVVSSGDAKLVNISADGSHVYFISEKLLDGSNGIEGQPNLYVWSGGLPAYVATVAPSDLESTSGVQVGVPALTNWTNGVTNPHGGNSGEQGPGADSSRTTPDGSVLVFESRGQLTSYPNAGHTEIYRYDDGTKELQCVSCNPSTASPTADAHLQDLRAGAGIAMVIYNLSDNGRRVFFETSEDLVGDDIDGINDVYEWQQPSEGGAAELDLITGGESTSFPQPKASSFEDNVLFGVTPDGSDVFFRSQDALTPAAGIGGVPAIYDARVGGGFPAPSVPSICAEEACRPPLGFAPSLGGAGSSTLHGSGNVVPQKKKGKRKKKAYHCRRHNAKHKRCSRKRVLRADTASVLGSVFLPSAGGTTVPFEPDTPSGVTLVGGRTSGTIVATSGEFEGKFGIESVAAGLSTAEAADHPDFTATIKLKHGSSVFSAKTQNVSVGLPPGLYGNPNLIPRCSTGDFLGEACSMDSQVGIIRATLLGIGKVTFPVFNLAPPHPTGEVARFGFTIVGSLSVFIDVSVRTASDYGITATVHGAPSPYPLVEAETIFWGNPSDPSHDTLRMTAGEARDCNGAPCGGSNKSNLPPIPFMTNPSACQQGDVGFDITSYQLPGQIFSASAPMEPITACEGVPFAPNFGAHPTNHRAGAPTGLHTVLKLPQTNDPAVRSTATMREAKVTLPEGMGISSSAADGLAACSDEQVHFHEELNSQCPDASKLGTAKILSPALSEPLEGSLYQRTPEPGHLFRLWLVTDQLGLHVKLPGEVKPDPNTGQLSAVFTDLPQVPVEEIDLDVWGGPRAPLKNPDTCGTYNTTFSFAPHSQDPAATGSTSMTIDEGCGPAGFSPQLHGGATNPVAGGFSPFLLDLTREDGEQQLAGFEVSLPKGELAKVKGVPLCPDAQAGSGDCPADSKIGSLTASAGAGPDPLWLPQPGKAEPAVYFAGPYKGAPYSVVAVVPAQAGPFDLGNVVARSALLVDPETAQATVKTDPLPQFVEGVPVIYRRLHVVVDRPEFTLNPTNCSELAITSNMFSTAGAVAHPSERFQVDGCKALKFKPKLTLKLKGGTKRADYPALTATLKARAGDANIGRVSVALPHSEFLAQEHIVTICTRVQFAADKCPKGSVYGKAKAWSPLLDKPLEGPVYLRSSSNPLPDLVMDLKGQIEIAVPGRIDSKNAGIRATFETVPDAPISKFVMEMKGGKKGLLTNSQDICVGKHRATVKMQAQNGRRLTMRPVLAARCGKR